MIFVNLIYRHFDILMFQDGPAKKLRVSGLCQNNVTAPNCKDWNSRYPSNMSECLQFPWIPLRYPQTSPKHPPDISRELKISTDDNRRQQTPPDTLGYWQVLFEYVWYTALKPVTFFAGPFWNIKISKCPYKRFTKIIGLWDFFVF